MRNISGEIEGARNAMEMALSFKVKKLIIFYDYEGIAKWCTGEWRANLDDTKAYAMYYRYVSQSLPISFVKVKGHSGNVGNDRADVLAKSALGLR